MKTTYAVVIIFVAVLGGFIYFTGDKPESVTPQGEIDVKNETKSEGAIGVGETKYVNGVRITLNEVVEDSRCPSDVQCIWAGRLVANVTLKSGSKEETLDLASDAPKAFDTFLVSITGVSPANKISGNSPAPENYQLTFKVENI